jgi:hypothetical protein
MGGYMKALSLKQPWAELILQGKKTIELRKWNTNFRGQFLIHASKVPDEKGMKAFGFDNLPCGGIVGEAVLVDVKDYKKTKDFEKDKNKHLANVSWGNYGFILKDPRRVDFTPCRGNLNFWEFKK